jgi:hypothetical protein
MGRLIAVIAFSLLACSTFDITSEHDPGVDFSGYETWDWLPSATEGVERVIVPAELEDVVTRAVEAGLARRGFVQTRENPDFRVRYKAAVLGKLVAQPVTRSSSGSAMSARREIEEGWLALEVIPPDYTRPVWRALAFAEVQRFRNSEERRERVQGAIHDMLAKFPPR